MWKRNYSSTKTNKFRIFCHKKTHKAINFEEQNSVPIILREKENVLKTRIRLEKENGEKVKANKTDNIIWDLL